MTTFTIQNPPKARMTQQSKSAALTPDPAKLTHRSVIPMTVLTGFLGSGKTTLLKHLLANPAMAGTAVIINEFGDVGLDDALVEKTEEDTVLLPSGCVCCAVRGDLVEALKRLHIKSLNGEIPPIQRIVLETTGLADPTPIVHTLMTDEDVYRVYQLDGVVTTIDAEHGLAQLDQHFEPAKQIAIADRIVVTKSDLVPVLDTLKLEARARALNRSAEILRAVKGDISPSELFGLGAHEPALSGADAERWLAVDTVRGAAALHEHGAHCAPDCGHSHDHHHGDALADAPCLLPGHLHGINAFSLVYTIPVDGNALSLALQTLAAAYGPKLLRVKGIVNVEGQPKPFVVHGVQHVFYPHDVLGEWPKSADGAPDFRSRFVFITKDLAQSTVRKHFKSFLGDPAS
jgi:G3E family GTPase